MKLVASLTSPFVRKCRIVLAEKGIAHELVDGFVDQRAALRRTNPLGKVPCLVLPVPGGAELGADSAPGAVEAAPGVIDGGELVFDSVVIVEYLDAAYPVPRLIPEAPLERMRVRRWEALADGVVDAAITLMLERRRPEALRDPGVLAVQAQKIRDGLAFADAALRARGGPPFAHGAAFSLADAALVSAVGYVDYRVPDTRAPELAALDAWYRSLAARPSIAGTAPPQPPPEPLGPGGTR